MKRAWSECADQLTGLDPQRLGDAQEGVQADPLLAAFDFADVIRMKIGLFGQPFLAQARAYTVLADGIPKKL